MHTVENPRCDPGMGKCVVIVSPEYPPHNTGGGGVVARELALRLRNRGYRVLVVSGFPGGGGLLRGSTVRLEEGVPVIRLPLVRLPEGLRHARAFAPPTPGSLALLLETLARTRCCLFHLHGYGHPMVDAAALILSILRSPFVLTVHGIPRSPLYSGGRLSRLVYRLYMAASRAILGRASSVTAVSKPLALEVEGILARPVRPVHNGPPARRGGGGVSFRARRSIPGWARIIACIGELHPRKGFHLAVKAMPKILEEEPRAFLVIAGEGGFGRVLERLAASLGVRDRVILVGRISEAEKSSLLSDASVVLVPSLIEPFGLVVLEAAAHGVPVVASNAGGLGEMLSGYRFVVERGDVDAIAARVLELLRNPSAREESVGFLRRVLERHSWEDIVLRYEKEYNSLAAGCSGSP
jgi:glycosyltransferase involved in cell wall biosynthesis